MGYTVIPIAASIILAVHHVFLTDASAWSKTVLTLVVASSMVIWSSYPQWLLAATLMQVAASIYTLAYSKVAEADRSAANR